MESASGQPGWPPARSAATSVRSPSWSEAGSLPGSPATAVSSSHQQRRQSFSWRRSRNSFSTWTSSSFALPPPPNEVVGEIAHELERESEGLKIKANATSRRCSNPAASANERFPVPPRRQNHESRARHAVMQRRQRFVVPGRRNRNAGSA